MADDKKKKTQLPEDEEADFVTLQFDDNEVYLYGYRDISDDEFDITDIEDDEEFERVAAEFDKMAVE